MAVIGNTGSESSDAFRKFKLEDFDIVQAIGEGSFSEVIQVSLKETGEHYALKVVDKHLILRNRQVENIKQEKELLSQISHPGVVKLHFTFQDAASLYFGLELCPQGELFDQIQAQKSLPLQAARFYTAEVVIILEYLKNQQIVHRDLKPENLLLDKGGHLKLIDFGSAKVLTTDAKRIELHPGEATREELVGTADYLSPEALKGSCAGHEADLWALGCLLYQMLCGKPPFRAASEYLTFQKISELDYQLVDTLDADAADLIQKLLMLHPHQRLGAGQEGFAKLKQHSFFQGIAWHDLWAQKAPEVMKADAQPLQDCKEDIDWHLSSLALSQPLKYEFDVSSSSSL